jgi:hypothetical protein
MSDGVFYEDKDRPCKFGHTIKYVKSNCCVQCHKDNARKRRIRIKNNEEKKVSSSNTTIKMRNEMEKDKIRNRALALFK